MREVAFLEFDGAGTLSNVALRGTPINTKKSYHDTFENKFEGEGLVLMQFTGLKDKDGKEIYEGDIVSWMNSSGDTWRYVVKYEPACFMVGEYFLNRHANEYLVLGNIYENPELLDAGTSKAAA